ncbi:Adenosylmethionine-8-amino-7-oxononanoate aminotransferase [Caenispirillum salinarum AK4]|uniref:Adenosylmethionine-8-amino-7-oxononanoate aminotransferase n=1 Tax=Caenispirillum salinarum AK4 TaxID=1238182 RepID=K9H016_9PROT|nr:adenosylmethionine--8-amino-7-oxononanoate transaminase [Caenispirillum salinarum]EKV30887.1 Adenosylmethionine-8-amino-7-oxononanoate aminotransferase [Caenispirillum salinarum AK4]
MTPEDLKRLDRAHVWHPFTQAQTAPDPVMIRSAKGAVLVEESGREVLDMISSWWVNLHGHSHPVVAEAIAEQARTLEHVIFAGHTHEPAIRISASLAEILPGGLNKVFFSDNGSTAVEVAMKAASQYFLNKGDVDRRRFIAFDGGYHGDTVGAMSAGVSSNFFDAWREMLFPVDILPVPTTWIGDDTIEAKEAEALTALDAHLEAHGGETVACIIEPLVQGASGMRMHRPEFLRAMVARMKAAGVLVILDEVMTGFGRMGSVFSCLEAGVEPDFICLSKGLTAGFLPMSVTVTTDAVHDAFLDDSIGRAFLHGHSFTANPLGCAAANASLELLLADECTAARKRINAFHAARLEELGRHPLVERTRLQGTIAAFDVKVLEGQGGYASSVGPKLKESFIRDGLLIRPLGNVVYLLPPYCVSDDQLTRAYEGINRALDSLSS